MFMNHFDPLLVSILSVFYVRSLCRCFYFGFECLNFYVFIFLELLLNYNAFFVFLG